MEILQILKYAGIYLLGVINTISIACIVASSDK